MRHPLQFYEFRNAARVKEKEENICCHLYDISLKWVNNIVVILKILVFERVSPRKLLNIKQ